MKFINRLKTASFGLLLGTISISINATVNNIDDAKLINSNWHYLQYAADTPQQALSKNSWQAINLPHTWNATDTVDATPGYRRGTSWYQRELNEIVESDLRYFIYFEGANMETQVYVNGELAGEHIGGYLGFEIEITEQLNTKGSNQLLVRVSNRYNPNLIPSQKADFFIHGGITRDVWLKTLPSTHLSRVFIDTPEVSVNAASTSITLVGNAEQAISNNDQAHKIEVRLLDKDGKEVTKAVNDFNIVADSFQTTIELEALPNPELWSPDSPNLYTLEAALLDANGTVVHTISERFGYRWFEMRPNQGFFVNGERILIRGTHRHEEHAGVGAAMSNEQHRNDMQMIKDLGANFVRLGHYPQDPEVYRAADELGLVIWDELPWCRGGKGGAEWEQNTENYLKNLITQNRNHASIAFWSLGNEMYWEEDFPGGGDTEKLNPYLSKLNSMAKSMDGSRMTTIRKYYPGAEIVDAFSPSIWAGWYGGAYNQYQAAVDDAMQKYPTFLHMEYGGSSHVGRHTEDPIPESGIEGAQISVAEAVTQAKVTSVAKASDWNENYMVDLFDWHLRVSENTPNFAGNAQWAFKDFGTPLRPENPIPYVNQKGLVDRGGKPKDAYYVFASYWKTEPFCYIESKTWTHRAGPAEGRDVTVYCNTDSAELFLNGKSLGKKQKQSKAFPAGGLVWKTLFKSGSNELVVDGYRADEKVARDDLSVIYKVGEPGKTEGVELSRKMLENGNILIEARAFDENGDSAVNHSERVYFFNIGEAGTLIENQGTPSGSSVIEMANGYAAIEFTPGEKSSTVELRTQNVKGVYIDLPAATAK